MKVNKFKPGDLVMFTEPWMFKGETQAASAASTAFDMNQMYVVVSHDPWADQWEAFDRPHVILIEKNGGYKWVDEGCLNYAWEPPSDEEVAATLKSIANSMES